MQLQLITGLFPTHTALHVQPMDVDCDILNVFRRNPGPRKTRKGIVRNTPNGRKGGRGLPWTLPAIRCDCGSSQLLAWCKSNCRFCQLQKPQSLRLRHGLNKVTKWKINEICFVFHSQQKFSEFDSQMPPNCSQFNQLSLSQFTSVFFLSPFKIICCSEYCKLI